jgi:hypothetical protein
MVSRALWWQRHMEEELLHLLADRKQREIGGPGIIF